MNRRLARKQQKKQLQQRAELLTTYHENNHQFAVDTNILMHDADLLIHLLSTNQIKLIVSSQVFKELDGLKTNKEKLTRMRAQLAFDVIEAYQRKGLLKLVQVPSYEKLQKLALSTSADEKIIATYLNEFKNGATSLLFLSNDKGARIIARNVGMPVAEV
ncbi:PIN domain-containing protein [Sporosarcina newyorkensis]|nr:PIN domain-containing protein [Sporosarcina newyorkensis]